MILQVKNEKGEWIHIPAIQGPPGPAGADGTVSFDELTEEQRASLKGDTGAAFTYDMFTTEQLEALRGPQGEQGPMGASYVLTDDDKTEIADAVLAAFPYAEEVSV